MRAARILVVDDEPGMLRAVARVLGTHHEVSAALNPREALEQAGRLRPDLAIVDLRMPEMSGFDLMAALKQRVPGLDVILMTGSLSEIDAKLARAIRAQAFYVLQKPFDRELLETLVERCLELRRLAEAERRHVARLEAELAQARTFQRSLLPPVAARIGASTIDCRFEPCVELGGDFFDYLDLGGGDLALLVADVSGHGVSAAMLTGIVKAAFHAARADGWEPAAVLGQVDQGLASFGPQRFVTGFAARTSGGGRRLEYCSAGHPDALLASPSGAIEPLPSTGLIVSSAFAGARRQVGRRALAPGSRLLVFTDGIVEAGPDEKPYGEAPLRARLGGSLPAGSAGELLDGLLTGARAHLQGRPPADDWTLLLLSVG